MLVKRRSFGGLGNIGKLTLWEGKSGSDRSEFGVRGLSVRIRW